MSGSSASASAASGETTNKGRTPVFVNIYDMYTMNSYTSVMGIGVYHCGIEVNGVEFGYGGHPFSFSGIFEMAPKDSDELGETFRFKETVEIGKTDFTKNEIEQIVTLLGRDFRGLDYHLINKNCNVFASKFSKTLCGEDIPPWVNRLAYLSTFVPFIERMIPKEWISPIAVQHSVESHMNENKSSMSKDAVSANSQSQSSLSKSNGQATANKRADSETVWSSIFSNLDRLEQK